MTEAESPFWTRLRRALVRWWLELCMLAALGAIFAAAAWSSSVERNAALADISHEHAELATLVSADFEHRLQAAKDAAASSREPEEWLTDEAVLGLLNGARRLEDRGEFLVLVSRPGQAGFLTTDGRLIASAQLRAAVESGARTTKLARDDAPAFGLPRRMAVAGLSRVELGAHRSWGLVVLASAERMRNREQHEAWRLGITILVVALLVAGFGALTRRRQVRELQLEQEVAVSTLQRERETLLAKADKMAALAALSTGIAHELGTPLGVMMGRIEQALERIEDRVRVEANLGILLEQIARIRAIVRGCLALARGDAPHLVPTPPRAIARRAVELVLHRFRAASVELDCHVAEDLPDVACESALFEQALVNVLLNACQATPRAGKVSLRVSAAGARVTFAVDDDGVGISDEVLQHATEPFFSTKRDEGGSGLGLTIAREIVNHHAGVLRLTRRVDGPGTHAIIEVGG